MTDSKNYQGPVNMDIATAGRARSFTPATQIISTYTHEPKIQVRWHDSSRNRTELKGHHATRDNMLRHRYLLNRRFITIYKSECWWDHWSYDHVHATKWRSQVHGHIASGQQSLHKGPKTIPIDGHSREPHTIMRHVVSRPISLSDREMLRSSGI